MTKSIKESKRLELIRKIRNTDFEFFDPESVKLKFRYQQYHGRSELTKFDYKTYLSKSNFKNKLKELLFPIIRHLNNFEFYINIDFTTYRSISDYCFVLELQDKNRTTIGDILFEDTKKPAIFVETTEDEDPTDPKTAIHSLIKTANLLNSYQVSLKIHFHYSEKNFKDNLKLSKIANLEKHFWFIHDFIKLAKEKYDFKFLQSGADVKFFNTYYNISFGTSYQMKPVFDSRSSNRYRNKLLMNVSFPLIYDQKMLVKNFIDYGILPDELKDDYQELTLQQIFDHANLMSY